MNTQRKELVDRLAEILEKNRDAEKGYAKAAENADSTGLKAFFSRMSRERKHFNDELKRALIASYEKIDDDGSFTGTMHRTWMDVKNFFSGNSDESMLEECIRGDKAAVEEYGKVLEEEALPVTVATLIRDQQIKIRTDLKNIKTLEDLEQS